MKQQTVDVAYATKQGIGFCLLPKRYHAKVERDCEKLIEHEIIHLVLARDFSVKISKSFDYLYGIVGEVK